MKFIEIDGVRYNLAFLIFLAGLTLVSSAGGAVVELEDGGSHIVDDAVNAANEIWLDRNIGNLPGTSLQMHHGGEVYSLEAFKNSSLVVLGGNVTDDLAGYEHAQITMHAGRVGNGASVFGGATFTFFGGSVADLTAHADSTIVMSGGEARFSMIAHNRGAISMSGGMVGLYLLTYTDGTISLSGSGFAVDGVPVPVGAQLSDYGTLFENGDTDYYTGVLTGTLADGSVLNNEFRIFNTGPYYDGSGDILIIPEPGPTQLVSLVILAAAMRRKRSIP